MAKWKKHADDAKKKKTKSGPPEKAPQDKPKRRGRPPKYDEADPAAKPTHNDIANASYARRTFGIELLKGESLAQAKIRYGITTGYKTGPLWSKSAPVKEPSSSEEEEVQEPLPSTSGTTSAHSTRKKSKSLMSKFHKMLIRIKI